MKKILVVLALIPLFCGCASIVSESAYPVSVNSEPDGAAFTITNSSGESVAAGTTPEVVTLEAGSSYFNNESYKLALSLDGYPEQIYTFESTLDGWYMGNLLLGGLIGMLIVDPLTGAMYKLPERIDYDLREESVKSGSSAAR